jgi:hypothetical protein
MANKKNHDYEAGLSALGQALGENDADMVQALRIQAMQKFLESGEIPEGGLAHRAASQLYANMAAKMRADREAVAPNFHVIDSPEEMFEAALILPELPGEKQSILPPPQLPPKPTAATKNGAGTNNFLAASPH